MTDGPKEYGRSLPVDVKNRLGTIFIVSTTSFCNYGCSYCLAGATPLRESRRGLRPVGEHEYHMFSVASPERWVKRFHEIAPGKKSFEFTGGEPFLDFARFVELLQGLTRLPGLDHIRIQTNGFWNADQLGDLDVSKIYLIVAYHPSETEFDPWLRRILKMRERGLHLGLINYTMARGQRHQYATLVDRLAPYGLFVNPALCISHTNPDYVSDGERELYSHLLPSIDIDYKSGKRSPKGGLCWHPCTHYRVVGSRIFVNCTGSAPRDVFKEDPEPLREQPLVCPNDTCIYTCMYSMLAGFPTDRLSNPNVMESYVRDVQAKVDRMPWLYAQGKESVSRLKDFEIVSWLKQATPEEHPTILVGGHYGYGNPGDEAILACILRQIREGIPEGKTVVLSEKPFETEGSHLVEAVSWTDVARIVQVAADCDMLMIGGGGLLQDYGGYHSDSMFSPHTPGINHHVFMSLLSGLLEKPLFWYSIGVGPLQTELGRHFAAVATQQAHMTTVRDDESGQELARLGLNENRLSVTADPVFLLEPWPTEVSDELLGNERVDCSRRPLVGVALRHWDVGVDQKRWTAQVAQALDRFVSAYDATILFQPFQRNENARLNDRLVAEAVRRSMSCGGRAVVLPDYYTPREKLSVLGRCDVILGMRYHSVVFATNSHVPVVALAYAPKVSSLMRMLGFSEFSLDLGKVTTRNPFEALQQCYQRRPELSRRLSAEHGRLKELSQENLRVFREFWNERGSTSQPMTNALSRELKTVALQALVKGSDYFELKARIDEFLPQGRAWQLVRFLQRLRATIAPRGSLRGNAAEVLLRLGDLVFRIAAAPPRQITPPGVEGDDRPSRPVDRS